MQMTINELQNMRDRLEKKLATLETYQDEFWQIADQINIISTTIRIKLNQVRDNHGRPENHQQAASS